MPKITKKQLQSLDRDRLEDFTEFLLQQNEELEGTQEKWLIKVEEQELRNLNKFRREKANLEAEIKKLEKDKVATESQKRE